MPRSRMLAFTQLVDPCYSEVSFFIPWFCSFPTFCICSRVWKAIQGYLFVPTEACGPRPTRESVSCGGFPQLFLCWSFSSMASEIKISLFLSPWCIGWRWRAFACGIELQPRQARQHCLLCVLPASQRRYRVLRHGCDDDDYVRGWEVHEIALWADAEVLRVCVSVCMSLLILFAWWRQLIFHADRCRPCLSIPSFSLSLALSLSLSPSLFVPLCVFVISLPLPQYFYPSLSLSLSSTLSSQLQSANPYSVSLSLEWWKKNEPYVLCTHVCIYIWYMYIWI